MLRIAYVTDLHLPHVERLKSLTSKMRAVRDRVNAFAFGGDTFGLERFHWDALTKGRAAIGAINVRKAFSRRSAEEGMPLILDAADRKPVVMINGNADFLAFEYLRLNKKKFPGLFALQSGEIFYLSGLYFIGVGSIEPDNQDRNNILNFNPWYRGVVSSEEQTKTFTDLIENTWDWPDEKREKTVLITHQPALGFVDNGSTRIHGTFSMFSFVQALNPIIHLTGHVHSVPLEKISSKYDLSVYDFSRAYAKMPSGTISVNPGGGNVHDSEQGVRMAIIDIEKLIEGKMSEAIQQVI